jgi:hypothetical protein
MMQTKKSKKSLNLSFSFPLEKKLPKNDQNGQTSHQNILNPKTIFELKVCNLRKIGLRLQAAIVT